MSSLHRIEFIGRIGADPTPKVTGGGMQVLSFRVVVNDNWMDRETKEWKEQATWYSIEFFGEAVPSIVARNFVKGEMVFVTGRPEVHTYPKRDGTVGIDTKVRFPHIARISAQKTGTGDYTAALEVDPPALATALADESF